MIIYRWHIYVYFALLPCVKATPLSATVMIQSKGCPKLSSLENGKIFCNELNGKQVNCNFTCDPGYSVSGSENSTCLHEDGVGTWSSPFPTCTRISCKMPMSSPKNGSIHCSHGNLYRSVCEFSCDDGFWMKGNALSVCTKDAFTNEGRWSEAPPTCSDGCIVNNTWYKNGEDFDHWFKGSPCKFSCTCIVKRVGNYWAPTGTCVHRCPNFSYPPGCTPVSDGCCASNYICPEGEKCQDETTGTLHGVGDKWAFNSTCECECLGEGIGKYRCQCYQLAPMPDLDEEDTDMACSPDDSQQCLACPIGMKSCPAREVCERWDHIFEDIPMQCTCYGQTGTRCVSKKRVKYEDDEKENRRRKRSSPERLEIFIITKRLIKSEQTRLNREI